VLSLFVGEQLITVSEEMRRVNDTARDREKHYEEVISRQGKELIEVRKTAEVGVGVVMHRFYVHMLTLTLTHLLTH
jgi:hypothetical protein